ncbi:unnamed protein product [Adineta steineri]|uniref:Uncharacterized protein n=1 Tax=Adineta steineri TaxID=433720 RepID=A0A820B586_9BILA|nr:unnamed protein product [Adineta steineri]
MQQIESRWPGQSLSIPTGNAQLNGITLRIGVITSDSFTMDKIVIDQYGQNQTQLTAPSGVTYDGLMGMIPSVLRKKRK